jgi:hypothetical protein
MVESVEGSETKRIDEIAKQIGHWRLTVPAIAFFEILKPFSFIASQALLVGQPLLDVFLDGQTAAYADLLTDRSNVDRLVARLQRGEPVPADASNGRDG